MSIEEIETPSSAFIKGAQKTVEVTDEIGRLFKIKKPAPVAQLRLIEVLGDLASNQAYMGAILPLICVATIDGHAPPAMSSKIAIESLLEQIGEEGMQAIATGLKQLGVIKEKSNDPA